MWLTFVVDWVLQIKLLSINYLSKMSDFVCKVVSDFANFNVDDFFFFFLSVYEYVMCAHNYVCSRFRLVIHPSVTLWRYTLALHLCVTPSRYTLELHLRSWCDTLVNHSEWLTVLFSVITWKTETYRQWDNLHKQRHPVFHLTIYSKNNDILSFISHSTQRTTTSCLLSHNLHKKRHPVIHLTFYTNNSDILSFISQSWNSS